MLRVICCPECGGDGGWERPTGGYNHNDGSLYTMWVECRACDMTGEVEVEVQPITADDLDDMEEALRLDEEKLIALGAYDSLQNAQSQQAAREDASLQSQLREDQKAFPNEVEEAEA